ncbi:hypothetical protein GOB93_13345 [Acetobacter musti]|uniref:Uncharacterized protein n=1 Tax=Acetobacter musti TaxID=864732 RepID=A0ABX0JS47_9PROT|nr:hypothetical protein [Acetobacter musti]NHN85618.1 hypothetical protein [Acetobacter musti]
MTDELNLPADRCLVMGGDLTNCLWTSKGGLVFPETLPITGALLARLREWEIWAADFEDFLTKERRAPFDLEGFTTAGLEIARALKAERPDRNIICCDETMWQSQDEPGLTGDDCRYEI